MSKSSRSQKDDFYQELKIIYVNITDSDHQRPTFTVWSLLKQKPDAEYMRYMKFYNTINRET